MKTIRKIVICLFVVVFLNSCVYSLFPIYTADSLVFVPELIGTWEDGSTRISFEPYKNENFNISVEPGENDFIIVTGDTIRDKVKIAEFWQTEFKSSLEKTFPTLKEDGYRMTVLDNKDTIKFQARIAQIGDNLFLDMYPDEAASEFGNMVINNYFPVHSFSKISVNSGVLTITDFDLSALRDLFKSNLIRLRHENVDGDILITAQPAELQKFLELYAEDEEVFDSPTEYNKINS